MLCLSADRNGAIPNNSGWVAGKSSVTAFGAGCYGTYPQGILLDRRKPALADVDERQHGWVVCVAFRQWEGGPGRRFAESCQSPYNAPAGRQKAGTGGRKWQS